MCANSERHTVPVSAGSPSAGGAVAGVVPTGRSRAGGLRPGRRAEAVEGRAERIADRHEDERSQRAHLHADDAEDSSSRVQRHHQHLGRGPRSNDRTGSAADGMGTSDEHGPALEPQDPADGFRDHAARKHRDGEPPNPRKGSRCWMTAAKPCTLSAAATPTTSHLRVRRDCQSRKLRLPERAGWLRRSRGGRHRASPSPRSSAPDQP